MSESLPQSRNVAAVILAAGASTRLGEPKQLLRLGTETLLERAISVARAAGCSPIIVVLGAHGSQIRNQCNLHDAIVLVNEGWREGMASSISMGVAACGNAEGVVLMTCDQPAVTVAHLQTLMASGAVTASAYAGRRGVPAYFPAMNFPELLRLTGDVGARELLREAAAINLPGGELDIDTEAEWREAERRFG